MAIASHEPPSDDDIIAIGRDGLKDARKDNRGREDIQRRMRDIIREEQGGLGIRNPVIFHTVSRAKIESHDDLYKRFTAAADNFPAPWNERLRQYTVCIDNNPYRRPFLDIVDGAHIIKDNRSVNDAMLHEVAHLMQYAMPELDVYFQQYHRALGELRTEPLVQGSRGESTQWRRRVNGEPVYTYNYFGKVYGAAQKPLEVMPMSMQTLLGTDDGMFSKFIQRNEDLASLTLGLLLKYKP